MIMKMPYAVLLIDPRGDSWNGASRTIGVYELLAMGHLEPWTILDFFVGEEDRNYLVINNKGLSCYFSRNVLMAINRCYT